MMRAFLLFLSLFALSTCQKNQVFAQAVLQQQLDSLQKKDNLSEWIYVRLDHVNEDPQKRLSFLMSTTQHMWRAAKTTDEQLAFVNLLNTQGYFELLAGNILESINSYERAYTYYLKNKIARFDVVEYTIKPLSNNYTRIGDYGRALYLQKKAIDFLVRNGDSNAYIASIYSNMAISNRALGNLAEAEKCVAAGLKLAKPGSQVQGMLNNILADVRFDSKAYKSAAQLIEQNMSSQGSVNSSNAYSLMGTYTTAGNIYLALNDTQKANLYFTKALSLIDTYFKGTRIREKAHIITQQGRIKLLQQQPLVAIQYFQKTLSTLKITDQHNEPLPNKIYGDYKLVDVFQQMASAYQQLKQPTAAFKYLKLALSAADLIRNEFADDQTKERLQADLKHISEKAIAISYDLYAKNKDSNILNEILNLAEQSKARTLLDQLNRNQQLLSANTKDSLFIKKQTLERTIIYHEKQQIENPQQQVGNAIAALKFDLALLNKQIKQKYKQFNFNHQVAAADQLLAKLPNQRIIAYFFGQDAVYLIDIQDKKVNNVVKLQNAAAIKTAIQQYSNHYFQQGPTAMLNSPKAFYEASHQLYELVLGGLSFAKNEAVIIVPDETLGYLSFDGLITKANYQANISAWPFFIKNNSVTYAFSLNTLVSRKNVVKDKTFTGLFIAHQNGNNTPLKSVLDEAHAIKKLVSGTFRYDDEVNANTFLKAFANSSVLHIGTHAYLSGKNQEPTLDFEHEKIFLFELGAQKQAPSLVVLSACRTADGLLASGEGIISLSRGFNAIGTPATIAGLWNVNDKAASTITANFYKHVLGKQTGGAALHQAKLDWLNNKKATDAMYLPYYWDSLIYMGVDQQFNLDAPTNWYAITCWAIGIVTLIFLGFFLYINRMIRIEQLKYPENTTAAELS